ncbi:hypothetical protein [Phormidesmis priestleyi]|nr:hypothetical protein [Phormidesmis priestleyi]
MNIEDGFSSLSAIMQFEVWFLLVSLASLIFYLILTGKINTKGLFLEGNRSQTYSWEKAQVIILTLAFVAYYLIQVKYSLHSGELPTIPPEFLLILGGSNLIYLWNKLFSILKDRRTSRV